MKKKSLLTVLLIFSAVISSSHANPINQFNLGLYGGYVGSSSTVDRTLLGVGGAPTTNSTSTDMGGNGATVGLTAAYNRFSEKGMVWGIDIFGSWHNYSADTPHKSAVENAKFETELKYSFGTAVKFGYMFNKTTLGYLRVGYINSRFELKSTNDLIVEPFATKEEEENLSGLLLGVGVDIPIKNKVSLGFSYDFGLYEKQTLSHRGTARHNFKPRMHFVNVSINYKI